MKPETILRSDMLEILFEHRNKEYGAYTLRRFYHQRLLWALAGMCLLVALFFLLGYWTSRMNNDHKNDLFPVVSEVILNRLETNTPMPPRPPARAAAPKPPAMLRNTTPVIVHTNEKPDPLPTVDLLSRENALIGNRNIAGDEPVSITPPQSSGSGNSDVAPAPAHEDDKPLNFAEKMPEFPGGPGAFQRFLIRNLRAPEDMMEPHQPVKVPIRFIVNKNGELTDIEFTAQVDEAFKKEILRVFNKMPKWKPGSQNGQAVAVYLSIPIIFEVSE